MKRPSIFLVTLLLALGSVELWARADLGDRFRQGLWVGSPQAICGRFDAQLGWANREGTRARIAGHGTEYTVAINSVGPERAYAKPEGAVRVLLLGDSTGWGWGVEDGEAFARLVEADLGPGVELINLSVPGYSTDQELLWFESEGLRYDPDLVLIAVVHNDLVGNRHPNFHDMPKPMFELGAQGLELTGVPVPEPASDGRLAGRYLTRRLSMYSALVKRSLPAPPEYQRPNLDDPQIRARIDQYWDELADPDSRASLLFARLVAHCGKLEADLYAFVLPHLHDRYLYDPTSPPPAELEARIAGQLATGATALTHGSARLAELGQRLGFETFAVDRALYEVTRTGVNLDCGDEHLNARGNRLVADVVSANLRAAVDALR